MSRVRVEDLARSEILDALPSPARQVLAERAELRRFEPGEVIVREGEDGDSLFLVLDGSARAVHFVDEGGTLDLTTIRPGEIFGELAVLDPAPRSASVVAVDPCLTAQVRREHIEDVFATFPESVPRVMGALARSLTYAREQVRRHNILLEERVRERTRAVRETQLEVVRRLAQAVEYRDAETGEHIHRMSQYSARFAEALGWDDRQIELLMNAAPLHDIGKIGIPDRILLKPGELDDAEWDVMRSHTTLGYEMLADGRSSVLQEGALIALTHHERWDGAGYPRGLAGDDIPMSARICSISDVFDALTSPRPYKQAWPIERAAERIRQERGGAFDPTLVDLFDELLDEFVRIQNEDPDPHGFPPSGSALQ